MVLMIKNNFTSQKYFMIWCLASELSRKHEKIKHKKPLIDLHLVDLEPQTGPGYKLDFHNS